MSEDQRAKKFVKYSMIYAAGNILRQLAGFLMLPVYTRYLTPADYGVVALIAFAMGALETLFAAKMVEAIPKFYSQQSADAARNAVVSTAFIITGCVSSVVVWLVYCFSGVLSEILFNDEQFELIVALCGAQILTQTLEYYALLYIRIIERPVLFVAINASKLVVQILLNLWLVVALELGVLGVAVSGLIASALYALVLTSWVLVRTGLKFDWSLGKGMVRFSWPLWLSGAAAIYLGTSDRYFISVFDSLDHVGLFELAAKFSVVLVLFVSGPISQHWQTEQFKVMRQSDPSSSLNSLVCFAGYAMLVVGLALSVFAEPVIRVMASPQFHDAYLAVPLLAYAVILASLNEFVSTGFLAAGQTMWLTKRVYLMALVATVAYASVTDWFGYVGTAAAVAGCQSIQLLITVRATRAYHNIRVTFVPFLRMSAIAALAYLYANHVLSAENVWSDLAGKTFVTSLGILLCTLVLLGSGGAKSELQVFLQNTLGKWSRP